MSTSRERQLKKIAYELNLRYTPVATQNLLPYLKDFRLFKRGARRKIRNVLYEEHPLLDYKLHVFDYYFVVGSGNSRKSYKQTVFFIQSKKLGLPEFWMQPEHFFHKIGEYLNLSKDIDFETHPEFSNQYRLKSTDEDYLRATMKEEILHFFTINKQWYLEGVNYFMIFYKKNEIIPGDRIKDFYKSGLELARMLEANDL